MGRNDAYYLQPPRAQKFYRNFATITTFIAMGQQTWWGYDPPRFKKIFIINSTLVYVCAPFILVSQIAYLVKNFNDLTFNVRGIMFAILPVTTIVNLIVVSASQESFKNIMKDFMGKIHLCNLDDQDEFVRMKRIKTEKLTRFTFCFITGFLMLDWFAWCTTTALNNYFYREMIRNKTMRLETVIYMFLPFDYEYNYQIWFIYHTINTYFVWCGCVIISIHVSVNFAFIFQLIGHIEILKHRLEIDFKDCVTQEDVRRKLIGVIKYHTFVLNIFRDIQDAFGFNVTSYYLYNLVADSLNLYQLMAGDMRNLLIYGIMILVYAGGLVIMSFVMEEIRRQSDGLPDLVYSLNWETMSLENRKMLLLLLRRIQPEMVFTAAGGLKAGVRPMLSIAKTSFSYYVMLKSGMKT